MKKILSILLTLVLSLSLTACLDGLTGGDNDTDNTGDQTTDNGGNQGDESKVTVDSVKLEMSDNSELPTHVFDGSSIRLTAKVKGSQEGLKVDWVSSDETLATVKNGVVKFAAVTEEKEVTISAVSKDDNTKKASHTFTIKHCLLDLANSRGNNMDTSCFMEDGSVYVEAGDVALKFADVYSTKFYVEATIVIDSQNESDAYPKFGIMVGSDSATGWNTTTADTVVKNAFFYGDQQRASQSAGWTSFNFVPQNAEHTDWAWGNQLGGFNVSAENKWSFGEEYTIGLLRDGVNYYLFAKDGEGIKCYKHVVYTDFAADEACYAWIGGWNTGVTVSNLKCLVGDDADAMYAQPTELNVANDAPIVFVETTYQINVSADALNFDLAKVTYESDNEAIATVDANGLVTATATTGVANITVKYGDLSKNVAVTVTDDLKVNVALDGKMDDALWTDTVKANKYVFNKHDGNVQINIYGSKNSLGLYFYVDYHTKADFSGAAEWWKANNFELRVYNQEKKLTMADGNAQWWVSTFAGGQGNVTAKYISAPKLNEATGMYEIVFEIFLSYEDLGASKTDLFGFAMGSNDGGPDGHGWYNTNEGFLGFGWEEYNFAKCLKIHEEGITVAYFPEFVCNGEHTYGDWKVITQASCAGDGEEAKFCKLCNHKVSNVLPKGEHSYSDANLVYTVEPTCVSAGSGYIPCNGGCGINKEVELPINPNNHTQHDYNALQCSDCNRTVTSERYNDGGWGDVNTWTYAVKDLAGDFVVSVTYSFELNNVDPNNWWEGVLPVVQHEIGDNVGGEGSPWVTRMDWWGWSDEWQSGEKLTYDFQDGDMGAKENINRDAWWTTASGENCTWEQINTALLGSTVKWTCTRVGTVIRNEFEITSSTGEVFTYWSVATDVNLDKHISIALASEFARYTVTSVTISQ